MNKERYESTELEKYYKFVSVCETCGIAYGYDNENRKNNLCPFCERKVCLIVKKISMKKE